MGRLGAGPRMDDLRKEYRRDRFDEATAVANPMAMFALWFADAVAAGVEEPNAMALATATPDGRPSARMVLMKDFGPDGFTFYTNYESRKGRELADNPQAALIFWWPAVERQVRVEGAVERLPAATSDAYFHARPLGSRLGAWVSRQSQVIASRAVLEQRLAEVQAEFADRAPARPPYWGGYRLMPVVMEFWQGGPDRLHDRLRYSLADDGGWRMDRLSP